jgi:surface polysaccharide O-acyltransferase-like enzyme
LTTFMQGTLAGPYYHFWYLYILIGLYLLTPIIRILVAHANSKVIQYFLIIWFVGTAIIPLLTLYTAISSQTTWFDQSVFVSQGGWDTLFWALTFRKCVSAGGFCLGFMLPLWCGRFWHLPSNWADGRKL